MPIPRPSVKFVLAGTVSEGEIFETSFWYVGDQPTDPTSANDLASECAAAFTASSLSTALLAIIMPDTVYTEVRCYAYNDGGTGDHADFVGTAALASMIGVANTPAPLQTCCVATLQTPAVGRSYRGRMYFPANGVQLGNDHLMNSGRTDAVANGLADFFDAMNAIGDSNSVVVASSRLGLTTHVTSVRVDNKADIQRRRADREEPSHSLTVALGA